MVLYTKYSSIIIVNLCSEETPQTEDSSPADTEQPPVADSAEDAKPEEAPAPAEGQD